MRLDAREQRLLLYTRRRKKHASSSLRRSTMNALIQLTGVVKCILVVLVFSGLAFLVKIIVGVRAKRRSVWGRALELALQVGP